MRKVLAIFLGLGWAALLPAQPQTNTPAPAGPALFSSHCVSCHGLDGRGGEIGPNIATAANIRAKSDEQLTQTIHDGTPGGMPAFGSTMSQAEIAAVLSYLRVLQHGGQTAATGDAAAGKAIFFGKAECSRCHMVQGDGGFLGSNLTGAPLSADDIRTAIVSPPASPTSVLTTVTLHNGRKISGLARDEDNFSIDLLDENGGFHSVDKADVAKIDRATTPLMPSDYATRLSPSELQDLVSFLVSQAAPPSAGGRGRRRQ
jgi:cytochrome c oxidase cbb3-type subunit III